MTTTHVGTIISAEALTLRDACRRILDQDCSDEHALADLRHLLTHGQITPLNCPPHHAYRSATPHTYGLAATDPGNLNTHHHDGTPKIT